jgi:hypothetical protein
MTKTTPLFQLNSFVDQVQDAKNKVIETVVFDDKIASPLKQLVEAQRTFTKEVNRTTFEAFDYFTSAAKTAVEKVSKAA